jgi:hypothetical protein
MKQQKNRRGKGKWVEARKVIIIVPYMIQVLPHANDGQRKELLQSQTALKAVQFVSQYTAKNR